MRIVTFSSPNNQNSMFNDDKISLRKLTQVKALSNVQYYQSKSEMKPVQEKKAPKQSHIKWVAQPQLQSNMITKSQIKPTLRQVGKSPKRTGRRKIFQSKQHQSKENISIPTFSKVPQMNNIQPDQQTQYYSMMVHSPRQRNNNNKNNKNSNNLLGSKVSDTKEYNSPFITNMQNSKMQNSKIYQYTSNNNNNSPSQMMMSSSNNFAIMNDRSSSITQLTQHQIPKLQQKLKQHDQQLNNIKNYIKNTQSLQHLKQSIKQFQQIQSLTIKQQQIQNRRLLLINEIQTAKLKQAQLKRLADQQANNTIKHIQEERVRRLEKIKRENQKLQQNLIDEIDYLPSNSDIPENKYHQNQYQNLYQKQDLHERQEYRFQGPIAFPSKDWDSQQQINQPISKSFQRSYYQKGNISYQKGYNTGDISISPVNRRKMNQISSIGFSHNKTQSFSMEANTFRDFTSPLDFQGDNNNDQLW